MQQDRLLTSPNMPSLVYASLWWCTRARQSMQTTTEMWHCSLTWTSKKIPQMSRIVSGSVTVPGNSKKRSTAKKIKSVCWHCKTVGEHFLVEAPQWARPVRSVNSFSTWTGSVVGLTTCSPAHFFFFSVVSCLTTWSRPCLPLTWPSSGSGTVTCLFLSLVLRLTWYLPIVPLNTVSSSLPGQPTSLPPQTNPSFLPPGKPISLPSSSTASHPALLKILS